MQVNTTAAPITRRSSFDSAKPSFINTNSGNQHPFPTLQRAFSAPALLTLLTSSTPQGAVSIHIEAQNTPNPFPSANSPAKAESLTTQPILPPATDFDAAAHTAQINLLQQKLNALEQQLNTLPPAVANWIRSLPPELAERLAPMPQQTLIQIMSQFTGTAGTSNP